MAESHKSDPRLQLYHLTPRSQMLGVVQSHDCVLALKALGEDTRMRIVGLLIDEPLGVGEISRRLGVSPYNVSKHLRILREAGLLEVEKNGRTRLYALPDSIRGRATAGGVIDLGCCRFQFEEGATSPSKPPARARGARTARRRRERLARRG
jgi:DNA-binding transcriptional ArsR family regulator